MVSQSSPLTSGESLKEARQAANLSQAEFAEVLGVSIRSVQNWERGVVPHPRHRRRVVEALRPEPDGRAAPSDSDRSGPPSLGNAELPQSREARST